MQALLWWAKRSDADQRMTDGLTRKSQHLDIVLKGDVGARTVATGFEQIRFEHVALPELALAEIDLSTTFLNRKLAAPLLISSMTGGPERAAAINRSIAEAAQTHRIAFGVGSQRVALDGEGAGGFGRHLRDAAPDVPILANFGAAQLATWDGLEMVRRAVDMVGADALIIHLNPLQEAVQPEGDKDWRGLMHRLHTLQRSSPVPLIIKEVGAGISGALARELCDAGINIIDVAGVGGTSWAAVEAGRAPNSDAQAVAEAFRDWGIPTARAVQEVRAACPSATIIASGGIRDGVDVAKAIRLGADLAGMAAGVLEAALEGPDALNRRLTVVVEQLRIACFCTGSAGLTELRQARLID